MAKENQKFGEIPLPEPVRNTYDGKPAWVISEEVIDDAELARETLINEALKRNVKAFLPNEPASQVTKFQDSSEPRKIEGS
jgi:hypothetical protein